MRAVLLALVTACYTPSPEDCQYFCAETMNEADKCPSGLECRDGVCREPAATGACVADPSLCGNGRLDPGEPCDDNDNPNDACVACRPAVCGDGHVFSVANGGTEACDDMNDDDTDNCVNCQWARCGDGKLRTGVEECEDPGVGTCTLNCMRCTGDAMLQAYSGQDGHCYKRTLTATMTQPMGKTMCEMLGGHLVTIDNETQRQEIGTAFGMPTIWIGLIEPTAGVNDRRWITGEPVATFANIFDDNGLEQCFRQNAGSVVWEDVPCSAVERVACELDGWFVDRAQPIVDNHAYRVVFGEKSWQDAKAHCESFAGGHLATIVDDRSQVFLGGRRFLDVWIGAQRSGDGFAWITGEPFNYTSWAGGEPGAGSCVMMTGVAGLWRTADCAQVKPFVCEID